MPDYMNEFDDNFEFENLPSEKTPKSADNLNRALKNTRLLKRFISDIITGRIDLVIKSIKSINLFDSNRWYNELHNIKTESISRETISGKEYFKLSPDVIYNHHFMEGEFKENTQYTIIAKARNFDDNQNHTGFVFVYEDGTEKTVYVRTVLEEYDYKIVSDENKTIKYIMLGYNYKGYVLLRNIMLYEGIDDKEYSPHQF